MTIVPGCAQEEVQKESIVEPEIPAHFSTHTDEMALFSISYPPDWEPALSVMEELEARIMPIDKRLAEIAEKKDKLANSWVVENMNAERFRELQQSLDQEEARLRSIHNELDPSQIAELESTRGVLRFWKSQLQSMAWDTEDEDGSKIRVMDKPHKTALRIAGFEDQNISKLMGFPATKRQLLDKLQVRVVVFHDRIEVKAIFPIEPINCQKCTPS